MVCFDAYSGTQEYMKNYAAGAFAINI